MLKINLKELIKNYDQNLLDNLRGFGKEDEYLKFWVPGTNDYQSFLNLLDALVETKIFNVRIIIGSINMEKEFIEKIETYLLKISSFVKNIEENSIHLIIEVDNTKYQNYLINNRINCKIKVSLKEYFDNSSIIQGSKGKVIINSPWLPERKTFLEISYKDRNFKQFIESDLSVYANQIKNVTNEFLNNTSKNDRLYDISRSVQNMKYLDFWMKNIN